MQEQFIPVRNNPIEIKPKLVIIKALADKKFNDLKKIVEDKCIKNGLFLNIIANNNNKKVGPIVTAARIKSNFDFAKHLAKQDVTGKTEGCGCVYCKVHHQYTRYNRIYMHLKTKLNKINKALDRERIAKENPELNVNYTMLPTSISDNIVKEYNEACAYARERFKKYKSMRKKLIKVLKIPME